MQRTRRFAFPLGLGLALFVAGCATTQQPEGGDPFAGTGGPADDVMLTVANNDFRDASIYAIWNGMRTRVGSVTGKTSQTFRMRWRGQDLRLHVDFLGAGEYTSEVVGVNEGDHLDFVIMPGA